MLLACHAKVNTRADNQATPLHLAAKRGDAMIANLLISSGADMEAKDGTMMTALHYACEGGYLGIIELLLYHKANINTAGSDRRTPLICAAAMGQLLATQLLLKRKASTFYVDDAAMTAFHWAAFNGHTEIVDMLSQKKGLLIKTNIAGRTALHLAAMNTQFAVVEFLLRKSVPLEVRCLSGFTPLHYACMANSPEITKLLLISGAKIEAQAEMDQRRPIHLAAIRGSMGLLNLLCDKGASLDSRDAMGDRALCVACRYGHAAAVQTLLDRGSPIYLPYDIRSEEDSPLCLATMGGHLPVVTILLQRGASAIKRDERGWQPYRYAAYYGHPNVLRLLMSCNPTLAKGDTDLGLDVERIGFAPSADISQDSKREVQSLLSQLQQSSQPMGETLPAWTSPGKGDHRHPQHSLSKTISVPSSALVFAATPDHERPSPTALVSPQELPGTLEQGLPASRSQTPEHMRRKALVNSRASEFSDVARTLGAHERAFARANEQIVIPRACHDSESSDGSPSPGSPLWEPIILRAGEMGMHQSPLTWLQIPDNFGQSSRGREWDSESSTSSVYTAPEGDIFELPA
ncbi:ankyrin [Aspergillus ellipticus CBS 707.79]|uniref:Ankyrin n=1 Tax=Aspergillus ellipticus CBS 707.79 TaxID=1448320 RepID=A0A319DNA5_9EURO|nr:ankyrin [Aspergillus ellipticus CBS 707.79]